MSAKNAKTQSLCDLCVPPLRPLRLSSSCYGSRSTFVGICDCKSESFDLFSEAVGRTAVSGRAPRRLLHGSPAR
jgi:hypothetical protein